MLKAFLIAWTLVAGLAAGSLMYVIGWRPQASVVADRVSSTVDGGRTAALTASSTSPAPTPNRAATPSGGEPRATQAQPQGSPAWVDPDPASTGSIGAASGRSPTAAPSRADGTASVASRPDVAASQPPGQTPTDRPTDTAVPATDVAVLPPARPAELPRTGSAKPEIVALPTGDDAADPAAPRTRAAARDEPSARPPSEAAPRPRSREVAARSEPDEAKPTAQSNAENAVKERKATSRRAARAAERAARAAARRELEQANRTAAAETESPAEIRKRVLEARQQARLERRQARLEREQARRTRVARNNGLEQLLDEFSRSGADYLHERTIRVGTRYLVERTTRHGTQYFYEQIPR